MVFHRMVILDVSLKLGMRRAVVVSHTIKTTITKG
jgi:hypothetical protein